MTELKRLAPLDLEKHRRDLFDSSVPSLDDWLIKQAGQSTKKNTAVTWVIATEENRVVAYVSLSMSSIDMGAAPKRLAKGAPRQISVLLAGRLAVDCQYRRLSLGTVMVEHVLAKALELSGEVGCRAVVVNALDVEARAWWERFGFTAFDPEDTSCRDLYLLTEDIAATIAEMQRLALPEVGAH